MARPVIHPGEIPGDELEELNITASELSRAIHVSVNRITQIISGKRSITVDTAVRLGRWFGTGPEFWLNLQINYELRLLQQGKGPEIERTIQPGRFSLAS